jgi:hypothetical protein
MTKDTARLSGTDWAQAVAADKGRDRLKDLGCQTRNGLSVRNLMTLLVYAKALAYFRATPQVDLDDVRQVLPFVLHDKLQPDLDAPFFALPEQRAYRTDRIEWLRRLVRPRPAPSTTASIWTVTTRGELSKQFSQGLDGVSEREVARPSGHHRTAGGSARQGAQALRPFVRRPFEAQVPAPALHQLPARSALRRCCKVPVTPSSPRPSRPRPAPPRRSRPRCTTPPCCWSASDWRVRMPATPGSRQRGPRSCPGWAVSWRLNPSASWPRSAMPRCRWRRRPGGARSSGSPCCAISVRLLWLGRSSARAGPGGGLAVGTFPLPNRCARRRGSTAPGGRPCGGPGTSRLRLARGAHRSAAQCLVRPRCPARTPAPARGGQGRGLPRLRGGVCPASSRGPGAGRLADPDRRRRVAPDRGRLRRHIPPGRETGTRERPRPLPSATGPMDSDCRGRCSGGDVTSSILATWAP